MPEEELKSIIPKYGDRLAVISFCKRSMNSNKQSLIEKLKARMENGKKRKNNETEENEKLKKYVHIKKTRIVEIGWICSEKDNDVYKQVRLKNGGGTRRVSVRRESKCVDILETAKELFFPNGLSKKGELTDFNCELLDFKSNKFDIQLTVEQLYEICALTTLRFYLATSYKKCIIDTHQEYLPPSRISLDEPSLQLQYNLRLRSSPGRNSAVREGKNKNL